MRVKEGKNELATWFCGKMRGKEGKVMKGLGMGMKGEEGKSMGMGREGGYGRGMDAVNFVLVISLTAIIC